MCSISVCLLIALWSHRPFTAFAFRDADRRVHDLSDSECLSLFAETLAEAGTESMG